MKKTLLPVFILFILFGCGGDENGGFPALKKYWTPEDYKLVNQELTALKYNEKELPNLDNPGKAEIFRKISDTTNFSIVAYDSQLGTKHRSEVTDNFFDQYKELLSAYSGIDRSDKYQYPMEFVELLKFGLALQIAYINTNNENIAKAADDPASQEVVNLLQRNRNILVGNYELYLDYVNYEDRFTEKALVSYSQGLKHFFPRIINYVAPDGDYSSMIIKLENMLKKGKNAVVILELQNVLNLLKSKTSPEIKTGN
jgi:hypothetical protein